jgi:hypothetical protein
MFPKVPYFVIITNVGQVLEFSNIEHVGYVITDFFHFWIVA